MIFHNKKVALICPAKYIERIDQKEYIESFDVVARVNRSLPIPDHIQEKTSNRCEVLYVARNIIPDLSWGFLEEIRIKCDALWEPYKHDDKKDPYVFKRELMEIYRRKIAMVHPESYYRFIEQTCSMPNIGMIAIMDILREKPKELYVTGMSFYEGGLFYKGYYNEFENDIKKEKGNIFGHDQIVQKDFLRKIFEFHSNVIMDDFMIRLLK